MCREGPNDRNGHGAGSRVYASKTCFSKSSKAHIPYLRFLYHHLTGDAHGGDVTMMAESKSWFLRMIYHIANKLCPVKGSVTTILYRLSVHIATGVMA